MIVTLQALVAAFPRPALRFGVTQVLKEMSRTLVYRQKYKSKRKYLVTAACEHRVYCATHVVLGLSEFGSSKIVDASQQEISELAKMLSNWFSCFHDPNSADARGRYLYNKEMVIEIGVSLLILHLNGAILSGKTTDQKKSMALSFFVCAKICQRFFRSLKSRYLAPICI